MALRKFSEIPALQPGAMFVNPLPFSETSEEILYWVLGVDGEDLKVLSMLFRQGKIVGGITVQRLASPIEATYFEPLAISRHPVVYKAMHGAIAQEIEHHSKHLKSWSEVSVLLNCYLKKNP